MNAEPESLPIEVLPPLPNYGAVKESPNSFNTPAVTREYSRPGTTFYHPASGAVILAIDFLGFGTELLSGLLDTPVICVLSFILAFFLVFGIQTAYRAEKWSLAFGKALLGATLAGMPIFIGGTILGLAVITLSGLPENHVAAARMLAEKHINKKTAQTKSVKVV